MTVWIVLFTLLLPSVPTMPAPDADEKASSLRYRGIERLLAKFEAESEAETR